MRRQFLAADARGEALPDALNESRLAALTRAVIHSHEAIVREQTAVVADLEAQSARYRTASKPSDKACPSSAATGN